MLLQHLVMVAHLFCLQILVRESVTADRLKYNSQRSCYLALNDTGKLSNCRESAISKWSIQEVGANTSEIFVEMTCCAVHEALNCAQLSSCDTCAAEDLKMWAGYRMRTLKTLNKTLCSPLKIAPNWVEYCGHLHGRLGGRSLGNVTNETLSRIEKLPFNSHCSNELDGEQPDPDEGGLGKHAILGISVLAMVLIACGLCMYCCTSEDNKKSKDDDPRFSSVLSNPDKTGKSISKPAAASSKPPEVSKVDDQKEAKQQSTK